MSHIIDVLIIFLLFAVYALIHSVLASHRVKETFKKNLGNLIAFYRLGYNLFAIVSLYLIYELSPKPHVIIYDLPNPFDMLILIPQFIALIGLLWSFKYICVKEFLGINQIKRYIQKNYSSDLDEDLTLTIGGPYKYSRHPIYFFSIMFLLFRPTMDLFYLTFFLLIVAYFYIGSYYEEKKLVRSFGEIYTRYQKSVPQIFPSIPLRAYNEEGFAES
ncbi:MAG: isoprenylcysteine carboxylmethyltransferase family protein [Bacteroidetes bacterium]|nr:isoprenylcysteine carboxylmethyltransferase family protein [Bacteroidota bacterium]